MVVSENVTRERSAGVSQWVSQWGGWWWSRWGTDQVLLHTPGRRKWWSRMTSYVILGKTVTPKCLHYFSMHCESTFDIVLLKLTSCQHIFFHLLATLGLPRPSNFPRGLEGTLEPEVNKFNVEPKHKRWRKWVLMCETLENVEDCATVEHSYSRYWLQQH